jgi:hypothetical protein
LSSAELLVVVAVIAAVTAIGLRSVNDTWQCRRCGLTMHRLHWEWFTLPFYSRVSYRTNDYYRLYTRVAGANCSHIWVHRWKGWSEIIGGGIACTDSYQLLLRFHSADLARVAQLRNPAQAAILLRAYDLGADDSSPGNKTVLDAIVELRTLDAADENAWWRSRGPALRRLAQANSPATGF